MWRQFTGIKRITKSVLTWQYLNREVYPVNANVLAILNSFEPMPADSRMRWFYRIRCLSQLNFYATVGKERKEIESYVRRVGTKVILAQFGFMALRLMPVAKKFNIPLVAHFHGVDVSSCLNNKWYRVSLLRALKHFSAVIVVGTHQKRWMLDHGVSEDKVYLIPCGVPTEEFNYIDRIANDSIRFIAVSRLVEKKGLEYTISAFSLVKKECPNVKIDIYGDGPLKDSLMKMINNLQLLSDARLMGSVTGNVIKDEMALSDVFVQHSIVASNGDSEGSPVATAEAAATGLPVVSTISPGMSDQVVDGQTGFLVEQKDYKSMAERMLQLARNPELRRDMGQGGRQRMVECYDAKKQIAKLEDVLLSVI